MPPPPDGYGYTTPPPGWTPPPNRAPKWPWAVGGVLVLAVIAAVAAIATVLLRDSDSGAVAAPGSTTVSTVTVTASPTATTTAPTTGRSAPVSAPRGLPNNGTLKVGTDIAPGEYSVRPLDSLGGYWERLSCLTGDLDCILANDIVDGPGYVSVLPGDLALSIRNLELIPTGNPASAPTASPTASAAPGLTGTDGQGFVGVPQARCNHTNRAVAMGRTADSLVVVCETGVGRLYYKGVRIDDGAAIEIDDPVATGSGFTASNNGVQYQISPNSLLITEGSTVLGEEPMVQYWER